LTPEVVAGLPDLLDRLDTDPELKLAVLRSCLKITTIPRLRSQPRSRLEARNATI
jgi:hypothetical protein